MVDRFQRGGTPHAAGHPAPLRRRLSPRPRQPVRRNRLSPQHRTGRHPRPGARPAGRPHHGGGDSRERPAVGLRALHLRRPRRPLGPHLRELQRGSEPRDPDGDRDRRPSGPPPAPRPARPGARHREALRGRRRHRVRHPDRRLQDRPGHRDHQPRGLLGRLPAPVRPGRPGSPGGQRDALLLERGLDRGRRGQPDQDARQPGADHGPAQGLTRLRRHRDQRLGGNPSAPG